MLPCLLLSIAWDMDCRHTCPAHQIAVAIWFHVQILGVSCFAWVLQCLDVLIAPILWCSIIFWVRRMDAVGVPSSMPWSANGAACACMVCIQTPKVLASTCATQRRCAALSSISDCNSFQTPRLLTLHDSGLYVSILYRISRALPRVHALLVMYIRLHVSMHAQRDAADQY